MTPPRSPSRPGGLRRRGGQDKGDDLNRSFSRPVLAVAPLFFLSGFSALLYQVIWQRILAVFSGVHIYSVTVIVTTFMAGLGAGSLLGGKLADRCSPRRAVLAFALCELGIGLFAMASPFLYYDLACVRLSGLAGYPGLLPIVHFLLLLFPTLCMGASLPFLARGLVGGTAEAARTLGILYTMNTLGAGCGALVTIWKLAGAIGFVGSIHLGAALNGIVAAGALLLVWRFGERKEGVPDGLHDPRSPQESEPEEPRPKAARAGAAVSARVDSWKYWAWLYGLSGFIALSLEILWFRFLEVAMKAGPYTFGHLLGIYLVLLALGSFAGLIMVDRVRRPERVFLIGQWGIVTSAVLGVWLLMRAPYQWGILQPILLHWYKPGGMEMAEILDAFRNPSAPASGPMIQNVLRLYFGLPVWLLGLPVLLMGFTYPFIQKTVQTRLREVGWRTGVVATANIAGCTLGSLLTGGLLLSLLGTPRSLGLMSVLGVAFPLILRGRTASVRTRRWITAGIVVLLFAGLTIPGPREFWARLHGMESASVEAAEDAGGTAVLQLLKQDWVPMRVNGVMHSMIPYRDEHTFLGAIPALLHPEMRTALLVGLGTGNTAWAAACRPQTERVDVYEIVRPEVTVLRALVRREGPYDAVRQMLDDPRIKIHFTDGRLALRLTKERYDFIEADPPEPSRAYSGNLYSREFFAVCRSRLKPGGILCTYAPTERVRRTVLTVFPYALDFHAPDYASIIIASDSPLSYDPHLLAARLAEPGTQGWFERSGLGEQTLGQIQHYLSTAKAQVINPDNRTQYLHGEINTDLFPRDEFDPTYRDTYH